MQPAGLYIHIPFCTKKCDYCDFYSITNLDSTDSFVKALLVEIEIRASDFKNEIFHTIFFGGGTPSLLNEAQFEQIWSSLYRYFNFIDNPEVTIEANPGTLTYHKLKFLKDIGFNRLSLGVQSFNPNELAFLGRIHTLKEVYDNFYNARNVGFDNINIDLMTAFPGITMDSFKHSLDKILYLMPDHISCYTLIFEPGTPFFKRMKSGELKPVPEDEEMDYYKTAMDILESQGYFQFEIFNFARCSENICKHNCIYWKHYPYLGLGPSAHSFYENKRFSNKRSVAGYINCLNNRELPIVFSEPLTDDQLMFEYIFLNLRLRDGIDLNEFESRFNYDFHKKYSSVLKYLNENNFIEFDKRNMRLSEKGWMLADSVASYF